MTPAERMEAAVKLQPLDRIPCAPLMDVLFPSRYKGWSTAEGLGSMEKGFSAICDVWEDVGGWDGMILPGYSLPLTPNLYSGATAGGTTKAPGTGDYGENEIPQFEEKEAITRDHYDEIAKLGWNQWRIKMAKEFSPFPEEKTIAWTKRQMAQFKSELQHWKSKGMRSLVGAMTASPLMVLSTARSLLEFTKDIYQIPDKLEAVMDAMVDDMIADAIEAAKISGEPGVFLVMERGGCFYYPLPIYERFEYPYMKKMVEAFAAEGLITNMHLDQDYTLNVPYFLDLPKGMVVAEFDSTTDIFKAKEILKGHMCIAGDVPASLTSLGTPKEVEDYCKKLIDVVGAGGGFILSSGCTVPADCKFENLQAMVETAKNYYPHS